MNNNSREALRQVCKQQILTDIDKVRSPIAGGEGHADACKGEGSQGTGADRKDPEGIGEKIFWKRGKGGTGWKWKLC